MYALYIRVVSQGAFSLFFIRLKTVAKAIAIAWVMSFRGAKRRGNPLNRNVNTVAVATDRTCSRNH